MAQRRMFSRTVVESDAFLDLPMSTQALYFHLGMDADDEGFCSSPKKVMRLVGANQDDLKLLVAKSFLVAFDDGVVVIKHWRINNYIQRDRMHETEYRDHLGTLYLKPNKAYTTDPAKGRSIAETEMDTECIQTASNLDTEVSIGKYRLEESSLGEKRKSETSLKHVRKQSALCDSLTRSGFLDEDELQDEQWDELLNEYVDEYGFVDTKMKLAYVLSSWKVRAEDEPIESPFLWLKAAMDEQFSQAERRGISKKKGL